MNRLSMPLVRILHLALAIYIIHYDIARRLNAAAKAIGLAFHSFKKFQSFKPPPFSLRDAGEEREPALSLSKGKGLNGLNDLKILNAMR